MNLRTGRDGTYQTKRAGLSRSNRLIGYTLVIAFFLLASVWFIFVSKYFSVTDLQIEGLHELERGEVTSSTYDALDTGAWKPWDKRNIFFIDTDALSNDLQERLFAESITVDKIYPNVLRLIVKERQRSVFFVTKYQIVSVDTSGVVTEDATDTSAAYVRLRLNGQALADPTQPPIIVCSIEDPLTGGYQVTDAKNVKRWIESYRTFIRSGMRFRTIEFESPTSTTAQVNAEGNYKVRIDISQDPKAQIDSYLKFLSSKPKSVHILEYIDARIPGRLYVK